MIPNSRVFTCSRTYNKQRTCSEPVQKKLEIFGYLVSPDKIRKYRADYNNRPPSAVSFMTTIASTSGRLHSEFVRILFLQAHRETDRFFVTSGVHLAQTHPGG
jgi:hypothetical protein